MFTHMEIVFSVYIIIIIVIYTNIYIHICKKKGKNRKFKCICRQPADKLWDISYNGWYFPLKIFQSACVQHIYIYKICAYEPINCDSFLVYIV